MIDVDAAAEQVGDALRRWTLYGTVGGLEDADVSPVELPVLMGFMVGDGTVDITAARHWPTSRWVIAVRTWIDARSGINKGRRVPVTPGSMPSRAFPNWLSPPELAAWKQARERAGLRIKGIEDNVRARLRHILADAIALRAPGGRRALVALVRRRLEEEFGRVNKNWKTIARTEVNEAFSTGVLTAVAAESRDALVVVVPSSDACEVCKELYLDDDGEPRVWKVRRLIETGLGPPRHPNCRCQPKPVRSQRRSRT